MRRLACALLIVGWLAAHAQNIDGSPGECVEDTSPRSDELCSPRQQSGANILHDTNSPDLQTHGAFQSISGYLSRSKKVLRSNGGHNHATFSAGIAEPGFYRVYLWWPQALRDAGFVRVVVRHKDGTSASTIDQRHLGGQWNSIGIFELSPGAHASVQLVDEPGVPAYVDAVRFEYLGRTRPALTIETSALPIADQAEPYAASVETIGGVPPYKWSLSSGRLPDGLRLHAGNGSISGIPTVLGEFEFAVTVTDAVGASREKQFTLHVLQLGARGSSTGDASVSAELASETTSASIAPDLSELQAIVAALPEGEWTRVNLNAYSDVWTPADLRPLNGLSNPTPAKIIQIWSSFAWDRNRGDLWLFGGGHAAYSGNDVYRWRGSSRRWERASLPSQKIQPAPELNSAVWHAIDGPDAAPSAAHTYDNNIFLPIIDRFVVFGGAAYNTGGAFIRLATPTTWRKTGPYFFDPNKADGNKVGGTTGSHVQRTGPHAEIVGGNMWVNRDIPAPPGSHVNGCTAYAEENGKDVVYIAARVGGGAVADLFKYTVHSLDDPSSDTMEKVGIFWHGSSKQTSCGFDFVRRILLRTSSGSAYPFVYWDLLTAGSGNRDIPVTPEDPSGEFANVIANGLGKCGLDFDDLRHQFALWCGDGTVWVIRPPAVMSPSGWTVTKQPSPTLPTPNGDYGTGILGKWKYVPNLDVFMGLQDATQGNIWLYKPVNSPGSAPTTATLASSANPATQGASVTFSATVTGSNPTGTVNFKANGSSLSGCSAVALSGTGNTKSASCTTSNLAVGTHSIVASYSGDANNAASSSAPLSQTITGLPSTTTAVASSANPATQGTSVTFSATVTGNNPTGTVNFKANGTSLSGCGAVALSGTGNTKSASCTTSNLAVGTHSIVASYSGDANNAASSSAPLSQTITGLPSTTTAVASSANPATQGTSVTFSATVTGNNPTGTVNFKANGTSLSGCSAVALSGTGNTKSASCTTSNLAVGTHSIVASYSGDANNAASSSAPLSQTITGLPSTTTAVASSANPATQGTSVTFSATVTGNNPTGTVNFKANGTSLGGCSAVALSGTGNTKSASCTTSNLAVGTHSIVASYSGDANNAASSSAPLSQTITSSQGSAANVALASAGAQALASSTYSSGTPASAVINNERAANLNSGGRWQDATAGVFPDWLQINFNGLKTIDRVVVYSLQDLLLAEPTDTMTFYFFGVVDFSVQGWNGSSWQTLGSVTGNNLVKRTVTFAPFTTDRIRVHVTRARSSYSRIVEIEAWGF